MLKPEKLHKRVNIRFSSQQKQIPQGLPRESFAILPQVKLQPFNVQPVAREKKETPEEKFLLNPIPPAGNTATAPSGAAFYSGVIKILHTPKRIKSGGNPSLLLAWMVRLVDPSPPLLPSM